MKKNNFRKSIAKRALSLFLSLSMIASLSPDFGIFSSKTSVVNAITTNTKGSINLGSATIVDKSACQFAFKHSDVILGTTTKDLTIISILVDSGHFNLGKLYLEGGTNLFYQGTIKSSNGTTSYVSNKDDSYNLNQNYTSITITGDEISDTAVENFISNITFTQENKNTYQTVSAAVSDIDLEDKGVMVNPDGQLHFYEFVPYLDGDNSVTSNTWQTAYALAKQRRFNGLKGYLATITSEEEQQFIVNTLGTIEGWIGGTRAVYNQDMLDYLKNESGYILPGDIDNFSRPDADADTFNLPENISGVPVQTGYRSPNYYFSNNQNSNYNLKTWYWVCGPEAGQPFYYGHNGNITRGITVADAYWGLEETDAACKAEKDAAEEKGKGWNSTFIPTKEDKYTPTGCTYNYLNRSDEYAHPYSKWNNNEPNDSYDREMFITYAYMGIANGRWNDWSNRTTRLQGSSDTAGASGYYVEYSYYDGGIDESYEGDGIKPIIKDTKKINVHYPYLNIKVTNNTTGDVLDFTPEYDPLYLTFSEKPYVIHIPVETDTDTVEFTLTPSLDIEGNNYDLISNKADGTSERISSCISSNNVPIEVGDNLFDVEYNYIPEDRIDMYSIKIIRDDASVVPTVTIDPKDINDPDAQKDGAKVPVVSNNSAASSFANEPDYGDDPVIRKIITVGQNTTDVELNADISIDGKEVSFNDITTGVLQNPGTLNFMTQTDNDGKTHYYVYGLSTTPSDSVVEIAVKSGDQTYHYIYTIVRERGVFDVDFNDNDKPETDGTTIDGPNEDLSKRVSDSSTGFTSIYYDVYVPSDLSNLLLTPDVPANAFISDATKETYDENGKAVSGSLTTILKELGNDSSYVLSDIPNIPEAYTQVCYKVEETDNGITTFYYYNVHRMAGDNATVTTVAENPDNPETSFPPVVIEDEAIDKGSEFTPTHEIKNYEIPVTIYVPNDEESVTITPKLSNAAATILTDDVTYTIPDTAVCETFLQAHDGYVKLSGLSVDEDSVVRIPVLSYDGTVKNTYVYTVKREPATNAEDESFDADAKNNDSEVSDEDKDKGIEESKEVDSTTQTITYTINVENPITDVLLTLDYDKNFYTPDYKEMTTRGNAIVTVNDNGTITAASLVPGQLETVMVPVKSKTGSNVINYVFNITRAEEEATSPSPSASATAGPSQSSDAAESSAPVITRTPSGNIHDGTSPNPVVTRNPASKSSTTASSSATSAVDDGTIPTFTMDKQTITINGEQVDLKNYITNIAGADEITYHCCAHSIVAIDKNGIVRAMRKGRSYVHIIIKKDKKYYDYTVRIYATRATDVKYYGTLVTDNGLSYELLDDGTFRLSSLNYTYSASSMITIPDTIYYNGQNVAVSGIAPYAFIRNKKVRRIAIGKNVKDIGNTSFAGMTKFKKFTISSENPYIKTFKKGNYSHMILTKDGKTLLAMAGCRGTVKIPGTVTRINEYSCAVNRMKKLIIGKKVRTIDPCAFAHDAKLVRVQFKGKVPAMSFNCVLDKMNYKKGKVFVPKKYFKKYKKAFKTAVKRKQFISLKKVKKK